MHAAIEVQYTSAHDKVSTASLKIMDGVVSAIQEITELYVTHEPSIYSRVCTYMHSTFLNS